MPIRTALCMIVKNESDVLRRCLDSVKNLVDEIVIADTGSSDNTAEIAKKYTDKVYFYKWSDDFAAARNFSFSKAQADYILWLDADDVISPADAGRFAALKDLLESVRPDVVTCRYDIAFDEKGAPAFSCYRERILRREAKPIWQGCVHECIPPTGKIIRSDFCVQHRKPADRFSDEKYSDRNLTIYRRYISKGGRLNARDKFYYGRELYYHRLYTEAAALLLEAIDDENCWSVNRIEACRTLADCYLAQNNPDGALSALLGSLRFGEPRASVLCAVGNIFKREKRYPEAIFWYSAALSCRDHSPDGDFDVPADRGINPLLELTCCHYALGDNKSALDYHRRAHLLSPQHPSVIYNEGFFRDKNLL